jgi:hypothetical protein
MVLIMKKHPRGFPFKRAYFTRIKLKQLPLLYGWVCCGLIVALAINSPVFADVKTALHQGKQVIEQPFLALGEFLAPHATLVWIVFSVIGIGSLMFHYSRFLRAAPPLAPAEPAASLPEDIPAAAWELWLQGKTTESASLLYRGAVAYLCAVRRVPLSESATEEECLRAAMGGLPLEAAAYFKELTLTWQQVAYGGILPLSTDVRRLCEDWPRYFRARR